MNWFNRLRQKVDELLGSRLLIVFLSCLALMALTAQQPVARQAACELIAVCLRAEHAAYWNSLMYDLSAGATLSIAFYWVLVRWPDHRRKQRIKRSFAAQYRSFKLGCIDTFAVLARSNLSQKEMEQLLDLESFKSHFKVEVGVGQNRWHAFMNGLNDYYVGMLARRMETLRDEISFVLHNTDIADDRTLAFFKELSESIHYARVESTDYEDVKSLAGFLWTIFTGWSWSEGYREKDVIADMIDAI